METRTTVYSRRTRIRMLAFAAALIVLLAVLALRFQAEAAAYKRTIDNAVKEAIQNTADHIDSIAVQLDKGRYTASDAQLVTMAAGVWKDAAAGKTALMEIPVEEIRLDATYKFLSQVGDYAMALSRKVLRTETISAEERENLILLADYADRLAGKFDEIEQALASGRLRVDDLKRTDPMVLNDGADPLPQLADGFQEAEEGFEGYPTLIYDGPFSDHIMQTQPRMTEDAPEITLEEAEEIAAGFLGGHPALRVLGEEQSSLPAYRFASGERTLAVTRQGGYVSYLIDSRTVKEAVIPVEEARGIAADFLAARGLEGMRESYYETRNGVVIVNFAATQDGVVLYPDLVKVGVALDDGDIVSFDARGYLVNHHTRELPVELLGEEQAAGYLKETLAVEGVRLAVIPTAGRHERLCYEFHCRSEAGEDRTGVQDLLVYVNAETGYEEEILLLVYSEDGVLTL